MLLRFFLILLFLPCAISAQDREEIITLHGKVVNAKTQQPVDAEFDIYFDNDFVLDDVQLAHDGMYSENLKKKGWYVVEIKARGYLDTRDTLWVTDNHRQKIERNYSLTPIEVGLTV